jgi:hypothetical protein
VLALLRLAVFTQAGRTLTMSPTSRRQKSTHVFLTTQEKISMNLHRLLTTAANSHKALLSRTAERKWRFQYEQSRSYR